MWADKNQNKLWQSGEILFAGALKTGLDMVRNGPGEPLQPAVHSHWQAQLCQSFFIRELLRLEAALPEVSTSKNRSCWWYFTYWQLPKLASIF